MRVIIIMQNKISYSARIFLGLILGIAVIAVGVIALLFSALQRYGYYLLLDGDSELYIGLHRRMIIFLVVGIILVMIGVSCIIIRR